MVWSCNHDFQVKNTGKESLQWGKPTWPYSKSFFLFVFFVLNISASKGLNVNWSH